jgi:hypothetical protein
MVPIVCRFKGRSDALKFPRTPIIRVPVQKEMGDYPQEKWRPNSNGHR